MSRVLIAVTDSPFPSLDPAVAALKRVDPELRIAQSASAEDILAVAHDANGARHLCKAARRASQAVHALQGDRPLRPRGRQHRYSGGSAARHHGHLCAGLLPARSFRPRRRAAACAGAQDPLSNRLVQSGRWEVPPIVPLRRLAGQVLGLVGFGNIPRAIAPKAKALGLRVICYDPYVSATVMKALGVEGTSFADLLGQSDFVSIHAPLLPATRSLMNAAAFARMKKGAFVVNTARGPLIDEPALVAALDSGHLAGAALDVVAVEPLAADSPLRGRDNVILTPHTAFYSVEALEELQTKCASDVARVLSGETPVYPVKTG